jgi:hypothetical protein
MHEKLLRKGYRVGPEMVIAGNRITLGHAKLAEGRQ